MKEKILQGHRYFLLLAIGSCNTNTSYEQLYIPKDQQNTDYFHVRYFVMLFSLVFIKYLFFINRI